MRHFSHACRDFEGIAARALSPGEDLKKLAVPPFKLPAGTAAHADGRPTGARFPTARPPPEGCPPPSPRDRWPGCTSSPRARACPSLQKEGKRSSSCGGSRSSTATISTSSGRALDVPQVPSTEKRMKRIQVGMSEKQLLARRRRTRRFTTPDKRKPGRRCDWRRPRRQQGARQPRQHRAPWEVCEDLRERLAARDADPPARVGAVSRKPPEPPSNFDDLFAEPPPAERVDPKTYTRPKKVHRPAPPEPAAPVTATLHTSSALTDPEGTLAGRSLTLPWRRPLEHGRDEMDPRREGQTVARDRRQRGTIRC